jgi:hypothetical protein
MVWPRRLLQKLYAGLESRIVEEVAKENKIDPSRLRCRIRIVPLPVIHVLKRIGNKVYHFIGKVLGAYDPRTNDTYIDLGLYLRRYLSLDYLKAYIKTLAEELQHRVQKLRGKLRPRRFVDYILNYFRDRNEIEAKRVADRVCRRILTSYGLY